MYLTAYRSLPPAGVARRPHRSAAATVELALVMPFLAALVLGMMEIGHGMMVKESLSDAAQKACRTGAQPGKTTAQAQAEVDNIMRDLGVNWYFTTILLNGTNADIQNAKHNDQISVQVSVPVSQVFWTTTYFLPAQDIESEVVVMLRQG
jgi:Flp pilus assembly protein TadG